MSTPFDTQEDRSAKDHRQRVANDRTADDEFIRSALKTRAGRNFWWRFLERCHMYEMSYVQGSFDATAFREGQRNVGQQLLLDILRVAPEAYIEMMNERKRPAQPIEELEDA